MLAALGTVWQGFWALDGTRQVVAAGGGLGGAPVIEHRRLPYPCVQEWLDRQGYQGPDRWFAEHLISAMDVAYRQYHVEQLEDDESDDG